MRRVRVCGRVWRVGEEGEREGRKRVVRGGEARRCRAGRRG